MEELKYTVIKNREQYNKYCHVLERLLDENPNDQQSLEEIELLTLLIEKWDQEHNTFNELDPVELLKSLMEEHHLKQNDLARILGVSKGYVSDILNYRKGFSKIIIRTLSNYFKVSQEAFNRPYKLEKKSKHHIPTSI